MEFKTVDEAKKYYEKEIKRLKHLMRFQQFALIFMLVALVITGWLGV